MSQPVKCRSFVFVLLMVLLAGQAHAERKLPAELQGLEITPRLNAELPLDLTFRNEEGQEVKLGSYFNQGKPVLFVLAYYQCTRLCSRILNGVTMVMQDMAKLKDKPMMLGRDYDVVVVSFNPNEKPELAAGKKKTYVEHYGLYGGENWHFLTGDEKNIKTLADSVGFHYRYNEKSDEYLHDTSLMVLTPSGKMSRYYFDVAFIAKEVREGLLEAKGEKIGQDTSPNRIVVLLCYTYDPATGKYSLSILKLVRSAAVICMLALAGFLFWLRLSDGRKTRKTEA